MAETPMTVPELLNSVDYDFPEYTPSVASAKFISFIKLVNAEKGGEENQSPIVHMKMLDAVFNQRKRTAIMCHRGVAKTTLMAEYMFLYIAVFGKLDGFGEVSLALYVSDSVENGVKNLRKNIEYRYEESDFLKKNIPKVKFTDTRLEFRNSSGKTLIVKMYGAKTGVRGAKEQGKRPQLAILDDLVSDDDARSPTIISTIEDTVHKAVSKAMHPTYSKTVWLGTPFNQGDPLYKAVESGAWEVAVYPVAEEFGPNTFKNTFKGSWPDRFTYEYVRDEYKAAAAQGKLDGFYQELMLQVISDEERVFSDEDIKRFDYNVIKDSLNSMNIYITTDFATSDGKKSDFSCISVWGVNSNGDWMWVDGFCKRCLMDRTIDELFRFATTYRPLAVGIEVTGQQGGFIQWIEEEQLKRKVYFNIESIRPTKNKLERCLQVQPRFRRKKVWIPDNHCSEVVNELVSELRTVTMTGIKAKHDDMIDTVTMMNAMNVIEPSYDGEVAYNSAMDRFELRTDTYDGGFSSYIID